MDINLPFFRIYLLKHKLLSNVVKFSISNQSQHEFIEDLSSNQNPLAQFIFISKIECEDPSSVFNQVQQALKSHLTVGELYQISPDHALKIARREAFRIPVVQRD